MSDNGQQDITDENVEEQTSEVIDESQEQREEDPTTNEGKKQEAFGDVPAAESESYEEQAPAGAPADHADEQDATHVEANEGRVWWSLKEFGLPLFS